MWQSSIDNAKSSMKTKWVKMNVYTCTILWQTLMNNAKYNIGWKHVCIVRSVYVFLNVVSINKHHVCVLGRLNTSMSWKKLHARCELNYLQGYYISDKFTANSLNPAWQTIWIFETPFVEDKASSITPAAWR